MSENSEKYRRALDGFAAVVAAVPSERWSAPSPCEEWTAKDVVGHVVAGMSRVGADGGPFGGPPAPALGPDDDPVASFREAHEKTLAALTEDNLSRTVQGPFGEIELDDLIGRVMSPDALVHTWDLARAGGIPVTLDPYLVEEALENVRPIDEAIRRPGAFGPKVDPPPGADLQTQLVCFLGRQP